MITEYNDPEFEAKVKYWLRLLKRADDKDRLNKSIEDNLEQASNEGVEITPQARLRIGMATVMQEHEDERMQERLSQLDEETAQEVTDLLAAADRVESRYLDQAFREGAAMHADEEGIPGGLIEYARELLSQDQD